jgi:uncharacterized membrane protein YdjX (TVP38/TMEM64 family)
MLTYLFYFLGLIALVQIYSTGGPVAAIVSFLLAVWLPRQWNRIFLLGIPVLSSYREHGMYNGLAIFILLSTIVILFDRD